MAPDPERLRERVAKEVDEGHLPACQVALRRGDELLLDATFGVPSPADQPVRFAGYSIAKGFVATLVARLVADGLLDLDRPVADVVPAFGSNGKDRVTTRHLLTHTGGFPNAPMRNLEGADRSRRRARFETWRLSWAPGTRCVYHATAAHWVLAELLETLLGAPLPDLLADRILTPLRLDATSLGVAAQEPVIPVEAVGPETPVEVVEAMAARGIDVRGPAEAAIEHVLAFNDPAIRAAAVPGAGIVTTAADVTGLYAAWLSDPLGWFAETPEVQAAFTTSIATGTLVDPTMGVAANRSLGFVVAGDDGHATLRGFGGATGPQAFGQPGVGGQIAWADPDTGLAFCFLTAGIDRDPVATWQRSHELSTLAAG